MIKVSLLGLLVIVALSALATTGTTTHAAPAAQEPSVVEMQDNQFLPPTLPVPVGSTVTWVNSGSTPHTATADDGSFDIPLQPGESLGYTFATPGTYAYHCMYHGEAGGVGMAGTIVVQ
jgi:plastocyanin